MSIAGISGAGSAPRATPSAPPKVDLPNDGDGDAGDAPKITAAPAPGTGAVVDKTA
jgi:hypothetical protein